MFFFNKTRVNDAVEECRKIPGAVLLDVREAEEYLAGHIPGAVNVPLSGIDRITLPKAAPLFVYCLRGTRSKQAVRVLKQKGYDARSIGGIVDYSGPTE